MEYNAALRLCPNCGTRRLHAWRHVLAWRWPLPLAIGLAMQLLSQHGATERNPAGARVIYDVSSVSQFVSGMLMFSVLAALLLFALSSAWVAIRRRSLRRRRRQARRELH